MKILRKYLFHVQESVFEGELTPKQFKKLNYELDSLVTDEDHIIMYYTYSQKDLKKVEKGKQLDIEKIII